ncbi:smn family protein smn1 [Gigaspora margarita]|uniref:Smn family protein smn1 n=1 Tax=Gigaspora margarita TaxID=4874 RepID=A0A8H3XG80_GIGMA|nr:smn family protein smn1 [Gigaspora margarita]
MEFQEGSNSQSKTLPEVSNDPDVQEDLTEENYDVWDDSALITAWDHAVKEYQSFHSLKTEKTTDKIDNIKNKDALSKKTQTISDSESGEASAKQDRNETKRAQSVNRVNRGGESALKSSDDKKFKVRGKMSKVDDSSVEETDHTYKQDSYTNYGHGSDSATGDNSYYSAYGWYHNYPPPPPPPQFYYNMPPVMDPNVSYFPGWRPMPPPKPQTVPPPPMIDDDALSNLLMAWYYSGYYTGLFQARRKKQ